MAKILIKTESFTHFSVFFKKSVFGGSYYWKLNTIAPKELIG